jgi:8-oxo-dGTP pyrophosphatase MutT (NUDIX family)
MPKPTDSSKYAYMFSDDMKILQKVVVFHPHDKTKILALKRGADHKYRPNDWDLPGGNVLFGEDIIESVIREVKEESGLDVESLKPIQVRSKPEFEGGQELKWFTREEVEILDTKTEIFANVKAYILQSL